MQSWWTAVAGTTPSTAFSFWWNSPFSEVSLTKRSEVLPWRRRAQRWLSYWLTWHMAQTGLMLALSEYSAYFDYVHRRFEASQLVLEQFFEVAETLGLGNQLRLEDSPVVSRTSLLTSSRNDLPCSPAGSQPSSPPLSPKGLSSSPSFVDGNDWSSPSS